MRALTVGDPRWLLAFSFVAIGGPMLVRPAPPTLQLQEYSADSTAFDVNSTLITGPTEAILVDAQYHVSDARKVADMIAASGKHLKAVFITHPDDDHYYGVATVLQRFPGTPVYMTTSALAQFTARELPQFLATQQRIRNPPAGRTPPADWVREFPDSLITPQQSPPTFTIDGVAIDVVADQQGDVLEPANSYLWIPSQRAVIAGDIAFNGVNVWLAASSTASRAAWRSTLDRMAALHPAVVVAGHKSRADRPDSPAVIAETSAYLTDFDAAKAASSTPDEIIAFMQTKQPGRAVPGILAYAARTAK